MKLKQVINRRVVAGCAAVALLVVVTAWKHEPVYQSDNVTYFRDTLPVKENIKTRDLDKEIAELEKAGSRIEATINNEWPKITADIQKELNNLDLEKIRVQAELSLKTIDVQKLGSILENINFEKIAANIDESIAKATDDVDKEKIRKELAEAKAEIRREIQEMKKINNEEIKEAMKEAQREIKKSSEEVKVSLKEAEKELKKSLQEIKLDEKEINRSMAEAKQELAEAKILLKGYQTMIYSMEADQLLDTKQDYSIEYKKGSLKVNGQKMDQSVIDRYKKYLGEKDFRIRKESGEIMINNHFD